MTKTKAVFAVSAKKSK